MAKKKVVDASVEGNGVVSKPMKSKSKKLADDNWYRSATAAAAAVARQEEKDKETLRGLYALCGQTRTMATPQM
jgi:hypothetical protein